MRGTEKYHEARIAGAKPVLLAYITSKSNVTRCFGKQTPLEAWLDPAMQVLEACARVLVFGDYRQALSQKEGVVAGLTETEMSTYALTCDNADRYFTGLLGQEVFLEGQLLLVQGFDVPGFTAADFLPLFFGTIRDIEHAALRTIFHAAQAVSPEPDDPTIDSTVLYALENEDEEDTAAEDELTYAELEPWYENDAWSIIFEIDRTSDDVEEVLLSIVNAADSATRVEIGIDADDKLYLSYSTDIDDSGTIQTLTGFDVATGYSRIQIDVDPPTVNFSDNHGNSASVSIPVTTGMSIEHYETIGTTLGRGIATDTDGNIYIADTNATYSFEGNTYRSLIKLDAEYNEISETPGFKTTDIPVNQAPHGIFVDPVGTGIYLSSQSYHVARVTESPKDIIFYQNGLTELSSGYGIIAASYVYVTDYDGHQIIVLNRNDGTYESTIGEYGTGNLQFNYPIDIAFAHDGNILVLDESNFRVQKMSQAGVYMSQFGSEGLGDGQFKWPVGIAVDPDTGDIYVADAVRNDIQRFNYLGMYQEKIVLDFNSDLGGLAYSAENDRLYAVRYQNDIVEISTRQLVGLDFSDNSSNDTLSVLPENANSSFISAVVMDAAGNPVARWQNAGDGSALNLVDEVGDLDIPLVDGVWEEFGTLEAAEAAIPNAAYPDAGETLILDTSERYAKAQSSAILPLPYGDLTRNSSGAVWPVPCINTDDFVYCVAGWPISASSPTVYVDGVQVSSSDYTFDNDDNYESQGRIATLTFNADPGGEVSVRCKGKIIGGLLYEDPIDILDDFLTYAASRLGQAAWKKNGASFAQARALSRKYGYQAAGVITQNQSLGYWLKNLLNSFLGNFSFNADGEVEIWLQPLDISSDVQEEISEYEAISLSARQNSENIIKNLTIYYANTLVENISKNGYFRTSYQAGGLVGKPTELFFDWCRHTINIAKMSTALLALYGEVSWSIAYQGQDCKFLPLDMRDQIECVTSLIVDASGDPITGVYALREKTVNLDNFTTTLLAQSVILISADPSVGNVFIGDGSGSVYIGSLENPVYIGGTV